MKLTLVGPFPPYKGGISHHNLFLYKELSKKHEVNIISWKKQFPKLLYPGINPVEHGKEKLIKKDKKFILNITNPFTWVKAFFEINREKPGQVIFQWFTPTSAPVFLVIILLTKIFTKSKIVFICHNVLPHERTIFDFILTKSVFLFVDSFMIHSSKDKNNLTKLTKSKPLIGFLPMVKYFNKGYVKTDVKKKLNLKKKTILFFGYVRPYKGLEYIVKAMPFILKKINCDLLIVGEFWGDKKAFFERMINKLGITDNVKIISDYVPDEDIGNYMGVSDLVVLPYISATQSAVVRIAYTFNKPIISTKVGGLADSVINGRTGFLVKPKNEQEIAKAIIRFYNSKIPFIDNIKKEKEKFSLKRYCDILLS